MNINISNELAIFVLTEISAEVLSDCKEPWFILASLTSSGSILLHGPSMFAVKAKIYGVLCKQYSSIAFDETSSYWSALKSS